MAKSKGNASSPKNASKGGKSNNGTAKDAPKSSKAGKSQKNNTSSKQQKQKSSSSSSKLFWVFVAFVGVGVAASGVYFSKELKEVGEQVLNDIIHPQVLAVQDYVKSLQNPQEPNKGEAEERQERDVKDQTDENNNDASKDVPEMEGINVKVTKKKEEEEKKAEELRKEKERIEEEKRKKEEEAKREAERKKQERLEKQRKEEEKKKKEEEARKEAEKKEQERKEAERKEKERKEAEKKEHERKEAERKEKERQEALKKEEENKEKERREAEKKDREEALKKEEERKEKERRAAEKKELERKEAEKREAEIKEQERKENERKEAEKKEQARKVAEQRENERKEAEKKEKARKEAEKRENERKEAEKRENARKEAEKKEQERKEAEKRENDRKEAERKEEEKAKALKKEAERKDAERKENEKKEEEKKKAEKEKFDPKTYTKAGMTSAEDMNIRKDLDEADDLLEKESYEAALKKFDAILNTHPDSPRAVYGKGLTLDKLGFKHMSNEYLEQSINFLDKVLSLKGVTDDLLKICGRKLAERQQFRGWGPKAVKTYKILTQRFPDDLKLLNEFGVQYLLIGQNERAREVFKDVLTKRPSDGFAKVHLGFILKTTDNDLLKAIPLLREGIDSGEEGTSDGRFYVRLGDALLRIGNHEEARHYYKQAEDKGLFLSEWQRSLYNVNELTGRPFWTPEQAGYEKYAKMLEENWQIIRDEGLAQLNTTTGAFVPEDENLRDTGDWKQLTLFMQGRKNKENCARTPKTCALIDEIPEARGCRRGQVKFSVMSPGIHVWPHTGPTNCRLRGHLGLVVPEGPSLRVVKETRTWKEGQMFIFDDSFEHEVWHVGSELRLILIVDFWHPELTERQRKTLSPI